MRRASLAHRPAFTLVELLMVVTIIGILLGILVPTVYMAMKSFKKKAFVTEVQTLANAIDQYKNKYGDYPPDGSDSAIFERHVRSRFQGIAATELPLVAAGSNSSVRPTGGVMDPAEALVFFLGGFSKDATHPFTGPGGPFTTTPSGSAAPYQYNTDRNEPFYEFPESQLTLTVFNDNGNQITVSNDETVFGLATPSGFPGDVIPVFHSKSKVTPFVYFDSRTYSLGGSFFNEYNLGSTYGIARPYKASKDSDYLINTKVTPTFPTTNFAQVALADRYYKYANDTTYQIISAGLDDNFGGVTRVGSAPPTMYAYPNGDSINISLSPSQPREGRYTDRSDGIPSAQLDNATNFADSLLEDGLPN